ncbi:MAG: hypothetical protein WDW36_006534 [Sanguina aurantia]
MLDPADGGQEDPLPPHRRHQQKRELRGCTPIVTRTVPTHLSLSPSEGSVAPEPPRFLPHRSGSRTGSAYDLSEEGAMRGLDEMLQDPEFLAEMKREIMQEAETATFEATAKELEGLQTLDQTVSEMNRAFVEAANEIQLEKNQLDALKKAAAEGPKP